jgi:hypothetical protein
MVLAIPFFSYGLNDMPACTAYLPFSLVRKVSRGHRCQPALFKNGKPSPRRDYAKFFGDAGLALVLRSDWAELGTGID